MNVIANTQRERPCLCEKQSKERSYLKRCWFWPLNVSITSAFRRTEGPWSQSTVLPCIWRQIRKAVALSEPGRSLGKILFGLAKFRLLYRALIFISKIWMAFNGGVSAVDVCQIASKLLLTFLQFHNCHIKIVDFLCQPTFPNFLCSKIQNTCRSSGTESVKEILLQCGLMSFF